MFAVMFVLDDPNELDSILNAWEKAGITGVTIIESTGFHRWRTQRKHIPLLFDVQPVMVGAESGNYTLVTIVEKQELIDACVEATEKVVGKLTEPNTGVLMAWPLSMVCGIPKDRQKKEGNK
ncbi:hypothetical protein ADN00_02160 [Ornatilinea apprima]|uniref:Nitrogen regulatory protein P-II n=1 Tax=Ornatilinea apprima TaxID=1134406 RepID=A0A0P6XAK6_9CHLR|nr:hypothetical protein [Ornatilinea apprima]KPL79789.1 hypothetical protein ADN00_02160 [Ornatilinea apprima]